MEIAYKAIGKAILAAQVFETALVPIFEIHRIHIEPDRLEKTGGFIPPGAFKSPLANMVKILVLKGQVAPELEQRLLAYIENRHLLVHRWVQEHGWPDDNNPEDFVPLLELAQKVENEALALTRILTTYIVKYTEPEWAKENLDSYKEKMADIFLRSHLDG